MQLAALSILRSRQWVPLTADDLTSLDREGARGLNNATMHSLRLARRRAWSALVTLGILVFGARTLGWPASGLLAFLAVSAALPVLMDIVRWSMARRWIRYSYLREHRTHELLMLAWQVEREQSVRLAPTSAPSEGKTLIVAVLCTLFGLPGVGALLVALDWTNLEQIWANYYLPLLTLGYVVWTLVRDFADIRYVMGANVGTRSLCLESDGALDIYALAAVFGVLMLPLGAVGALVLPFLVQLLRLAWCVWRYVWLRQARHMLSRRVHLHQTASARALAGAADLVARQTQVQPGEPKSR